ncbi:MAG: hypothetical protein P4L33_05660 [Capsulimonadaceae bacterium]|nr:hypothetical protein [Capsulimonadaceae bacterium]
MKLNAYIMAAEPDFIKASVLSYYDLIDTLVVSYDERGVGWTGHPLPIDECLSRLKAIDRDHKMVFVPGQFARPGHGPLDNDTFQRQNALRIAGEGADFVIQLDTDEVLANPRIFLECVAEAHAHGYKALDFPARWIYRQLGSGRYLEWCSRFWGVTAGYPGPVAVAPGVTLTCARQCNSPSYRVDFKLTNTGGPLVKGRPIHRVIAQGDGIYHYSWARDEKSLLDKFRAWGHARDRDWRPEFERWLWCGRHPYAAMLMSPLNRGSMMGKHLRIISVPNTPFEER